MRAAAVLLLVCASPAWADVRLPALFSDGCVLQRGRALPVWGWADPGERVQVCIDDFSGTAIADERGDWSVMLPALEPGPARTLSVCGVNAIDVLDVAVGDVWLCAGQSNMALPLRKAHAADEAIAAADYPSLRWFTVARVPSSSPATDVQARWQRTSPDNVAELSALAYFFGRDLHIEQGVPVGLIVTAWGWTRAETWMGLDMFGDEPLFEPLLRLRERVRAQSGGAVEHRVAGSLWNGMVAPLVPFGLRGVIWYQGEAHAERARQYRALFSALIRGWRRAWGTELPFLFVQLPNFRARELEPGASTWAELREAQAAALALPATGMAVTLDLGKADKIHGSDKREVGRRLALLARNIAFGEDVACRSPELAAVAAQDSGAMRLTFEHTAGGLATRDRAAPRGFALAGEDRVFHWAEAEIVGDGVVVRSSAVPHPLAVRYAWADNPDCNLIGGTGLPVPSLRSDDWPITEELGGPSPTEQRRRERAKSKRGGQRPVRK